MKRRKILYVSGTRADYGLIRETLFCIEKHPKLQLDVVVAGMHVMKEFGNTLQEIKKDGFRVHVIKAAYRNDDKQAAVAFVGDFLSELAKKISRIKPDIILVLGDRAEPLAGAIAGAYLAIPVAHVHGGDKSMTVDEYIRHAVTKLSSLHFAVTQKSAQRILKMGEEKQRIYVVGAPGLDSMLHTKLIPAQEISEKYHVDISKPLLLVSQHPVTSEIDQAPRAMQETMEAIRELGHRAIVVYPNADAGGRAMIKVIERYRKYPFITIYKNIPHHEYVSLMNVASVMVGNSSSGIIEAPSFHLPVVNIGTRQQGRERGNNVIEVGYQKKAIKEAIHKALHDKRFLQQVQRSKSPYQGKGMAGTAIAKVLASVVIDKKLLEKKITY